MDTEQKGGEIGMESGLFGGELYRGGQQEGVLKEELWLEGRCQSWS